MNKYFFIFLSYFLLLFNLLNASSNKNKTETKKLFHISEYLTYEYKKTSTFDWLLHIDEDLSEFVMQSFAQENLNNLIFLGAGTLLIMQYDEELVAEAKTIAKNNNISNSTGGINPFTLPENNGEWLYFLGDGRIPLFISMYMGASGYLTDDLRQTSVSKQLLEVFSFGIVTQVLKRFFARETPNHSSKKGGKWHFYPGEKEYAKNTPKYDAFPSGHIATAMAMTVVLADNYSEYKIPLWTGGITIMTLTAFQMMNNGVHWASDYPLGMAIGYLMGKIVVNRNRKVIDTSTVKFIPIIKNNNELGLEIQKSF